MKKYILLIVVVISLASCGKYSYPEKEEISHANGAALDSLEVSYLLDEIKFDGTKHTLNWNKERLAEINNLYKIADEMILYNYYLKRDIYRITLVEKDKAPLILSINKEDKRNWLVSKRIIDTNPVGSTDQLVAYYDNYTKELDGKVIHSFDSIFATSNFYQLPNNEADKLYESYCLVEAHEKRNYWLVYRSLDDASLKGIATYVKSLSRFDKE